MDKQGDAEEYRELEEFLWRDSLWVDGESFLRADESAMREYIHAQWSWEATTGRGPEAAAVDFIRRAFLVLLHRVKISPRRLTIGALGF